jgi:coenzyme F420-0:L-glutamate ligase/coenzyme F420-1:gamma-L-glutamate ligase
LIKGHHSTPSLLIPVKLPTVRIGDNLGRAVIGALAKCDLQLDNGDIIAVSSKVVAATEGRVARLKSVQVTETARQFSRKWGIDPRLVTLVLGESDKILGGVPGFLLTIKNGILTANAGIDLKNSPRGTATFWPHDADISASQLRKSLERASGKRLGVIVVDSRVTPLRLGTVGLALGVSGFLAVRDFRGKPDIFGRKVKATQANIADDLASSAHVLMGESHERQGLIIIRRAPVLLRDGEDSKRTLLSREKCLIASNIPDYSQTAYACHAS